MCCHQCSFPTDPPTVAGRQQISAQPEVRATRSRPFIQINYLRIEHPSKTSINVDGSLGMKLGDPSNMNLHRASTISYGEMVPSSELAAGSSSVPCSPGGLKHSYSVHTYSKTGSNDPMTSKKENMSKKICQNLRRKLSAVNKLRVRLQSVGSAKPESKDIDSTVVSDHAKVSHSPKATLPMPEMDTSYYFPRSTDLPSQQGCLHATQAELAVHLVHELRGVQSTFATESFENDSLQRKDVQVAFAPPLPYSQTSMVSAFSSQWASSGSERQSSWQSLQCSDISGITPETSLSETDWVHDRLAYSAIYDVVASPTQPLNIHTHLAVPRASIIDGPLIDSPTSGDLFDFPLQQQIAELDTAAHPWSILQELDAGGAAILPSYLGGVQQPAEAEELVLSSPGFVDLLQDHSSDFGHIDESLPEYATWEPSVDATNSIPSRFLDACRLYANSISDTCHGNVKTVLETAFEVTKLYYLKGADIPGRTPTKTPKTVWTEPLTIEAALRGINCLLTYDAVPTLYELVSLAFLSLALLGLSLDTSDLAVVVRILHHQAKSWSSLIPTKLEKAWFGDFIDDLWLLAEQDQGHTRLQAVARERPLRVNSQPLSLMDSNDFVIQVAQIFIHFAADANAQMGSKSFPSIHTILEEDYREMLGTLPHYTYSVASSPLLELFEAAGGVPMPDTYGALESFLRADRSQDRPGAGAPRCMLAKRILKVLSGRYVGRFALWLYRELLSSAQRVVSHPQRLTQAEPQPLPPMGAQLLQASKSPEMNTSPYQAKVGTQGPGPRAPRKLGTKTPPNPHQAVKRKSSSDSNGKIFRCAEHGQVFTGAYAENSYKRHMSRTKQHGSTQFKCHICQTHLPRVDHFKAHMIKWHGLNVQGRSGEYTFENINDDGKMAELEGSAGVATYELAYVPN